MPLSTQLLIGISAGIATGLVVGERAAILPMGADAYIKLLQVPLRADAEQDGTGGIAVGLRSLPRRRARGQQAGAGDAAHKSVPHSWFVRHVD